MGDPLSPPSAIAFACFDEYHCRLDSFIHCLPGSTAADSHSVCRYLDDRFDALLTTKLSGQNFESYCDHVGKSVYEHDLTDKLIVLKRTGLTYLHYKLVIYNNHRNIKTIYYNKNASIIYSGFQDHGRFYHKAAPSTIGVKVNAIANVLTRAFSACTFPSDSLLPILSILYECSLLGYSIRDLGSVLRRCFRRHPHQVWLCTAIILSKGVLWTLKIARMIHDLPE